MSTSGVADLVAFNFLEDVEQKQSLLADGDVCRRVRRVIEALESLRPKWEAQLARQHVQHSSWN